MRGQGTWFHLNWQSGSVAPSRGWILKASGPTANAVGYDLSRLPALTRSPRSGFHHAAQFAFAQAGAELAASLDSRGVPDDFAGLSVAGN